MDAHEEDFFPDLDNLSSDMSLTGNNTNNGSPFASAPALALALYVIFYYLF
jgi:hypothetical protein